MMLGTLLFSGVLAGSGITISFGGFDPATATSIWGYTTVAILLIYYSAPLSVLAEVVRTRNSSQLFVPLAAMATCNGLLWTVYGLAVNDTFVWGPNLVGAIFGVVQIVLCWVLPRDQDREK